MIFVTIGTHPGQFTRLIKRIDDIAPQIDEKIIIQRGFTLYVPKNCESFEFCDNIDEYYKKARIVIVHSATSLLEFILKYKKPLITVPRQAKFGEHINDHQVEFAEYYSKKTGALRIINISELTAPLLKNYKKIAKFDNKKLVKLQNYFKGLFNEKK